MCRVCVLCVCRVCVLCHALRLCAVPCVAVALGPGACLVCVCVCLWVCVGLSHTPFVSRVCVLSLCVLLIELHTQECEMEDPLKNDDDEALGVTPSTARARDTDAFANFNFTDPNFFSSGTNPPGVSDREGGRERGRGREKR